MLTRLFVPAIVLLLAPFAAPLHASEGGASGRAAAVKEVSFDEPDYRSESMSELKNEAPSPSGVYDGLAENEAPSPSGVYDGLARAEFVYGELRSQAMRDRGSRPPVR